MNESQLNQLRETNPGNSNNQRISSTERHRVNQSMAQNYNTTYVEKQKADSKRKDKSIDFNKTTPENFSIQSALKRSLMKNQGQKHEFY